VNSAYLKHKDMGKKWSIIAAFLVSIIGMIAVFIFWRSGLIENLPLSNTSAPGSTDNNHSPTSTFQYPIHKNITATTFWIGESASSSNSFISNSKSAWDEKWQTHYGGFDDPKNRSGFYPADFIPLENPFYFALPYNDFDSDGKRKKDVAKIIYWANDNSWSESQSMLKNQWVKISADGKTVYAQWEDVGPFGEDDKAYVFGNSAPKSKENNNAGIDLSPAARDYLNLDGESKVDWQFIKEADVPDGPWKKIVTTS
jgi:hypothetical protein